MIERVRKRMEQLKMYHTLELLPDLIEEALKDKVHPLEFLDRVLTLEVQAREERRIATSLRLSGLPRGMHLDNFDFSFQPSLDRARIEFLATGDFIRRKENVLFFGPPGVGKTHLAVVLGVRAIELGYSVAYYTVEELLQQLKKRAEIPVAKHRRQGYLKCALVILDELGYQHLNRHETHLFFQFIAARYLKGSLIVTSNRSVRDWVTIFANDELATTALLDRLLHKAHIFHIDGRSYRLKDLETYIQGTSSNPPT